jgi:hypothetical protein
LLKNATAAQLLPQLQEVIKELNKFGTWQIPWGSINRFQRQTGAIDLSIMMHLLHATSLWGSLPAYKAIIKKTQN